MNINFLIEKSNNFNSLIIDSGIQRDLQGFQTTLGQPNVNQNLITLSDIIGKVTVILDNIYNSSVPDDMLIVLPTENNYQFAIKDYIKDLNVIKEVTTLPPPQIHSQMTTLINNLVNHINNNIQKITKLMEMITPYYKKENEMLDKTKESLLAVIFNNEKNFRTLPELSLSIKKWNQAFSIFSQIMTSTPYEDVEIVSIYDGSVDFIFNFNIDISIDLTEIVKYGLIALGGYFAYLKKAKDIIDTYQGNEKLIKMEKERKELLLENVYASISEKMKMIHSEKKEKDQKITDEAIDKKIETVAKIITEHLVEGNEVKLLSFEKKETEELIQDIKNHSQIVRNGFKSIDKEELKLLMSKHIIKEENL